MKFESAKHHKYTLHYVLINKTNANINRLRVLTQSTCSKRWEKCSLNQSAKLGDNAKESIPLITLANFESKEAKIGYTCITNSPFQKGNITLILDSKLSCLVD